MPLEALSRTCGADVIYYTHFNLKRKIDVYIPHVIHKDLNITVIGQVEDITIMSTTEKDDTKLNRQDFFVEIDDTIAKQFLNKVLRCQKETLLGRLRKCMLHVCCDGRCYIRN